MATDVVKAAISSILQDKDFNLQTPRMKIARESAQKMLDAISGERERERERELARFFFLALSPFVCALHVIVCHSLCF